MQKDSYGLNADQVSEMRSILLPYMDKINAVDVFGSRAMGNYRDNSDIDIVIRGNVDEGTIDRLRTLFDESNLPVKVDVFAYNFIEYPPLKQHIDLCSRTLFGKFM